MKSIVCIDLSCLIIILKKIVKKLTYINPNPQGKTKILKLTIDNQ